MRDFVEVRARALHIPVRAALSVFGEGMLHDIFSLHFLEGKLRTNIADQLGLKVDVKLADFTKCRVHADKLILVLQV